MRAPMTSRVATGESSREMRLDTNNNNNSRKRFVAPEATARNNRRTMTLPTASLAPLEAPRSGMQMSCESVAFAIDVLTDPETMRLIDAATALLVGTGRGIFFFFFFFLRLAPPHLNGYRLTGSHTKQLTTFNSCRSAATVPTRRNVTSADCSYLDDYILGRTVFFFLLAPTFCFSTVEPPHSARPSSGGSVDQLILRFELWPLSLPMN